MRYGYLINKIKSKLKAKPTKKYRKFSKKFWDLGQKIYVSNIIEENK